MQIITYGCSFTKYIYPTYADILNLEIPVINRGFPGSGNDRIYYNIMQDYHTGILEKCSLIVVQWSGENRFEYLNRKTKWIGNGPITLPDNAHIFNKVSKWYNTEYELTKTLNLITVTKHLLGSLDVPVFYMSMLEVTQRAQLQGINLNFIDIDNLKDTYAGGYEFDNVSWKKDNHPTVIEHLNIANNIANKYNIHLSKNTIIRAQEVDSNIRTNRLFEDVHL